MCFIPPVPSSSLRSLPSRRLLVLTAKSKTGDDDQKCGFASSDLQYLVYVSAEFPFGTSAGVASAKAGKGGQKQRVSSLHFLVFVIAEFGVTTSLECWGVFLRTFSPVWPSKSLFQSLSARPWGARQRAGVVTVVEELCLFCGMGACAFASCVAGLCSLWCRLLLPLFSSSSSSSPFGLSDTSTVLG